MNPNRQALTKRLPATLLIAMTAVIGGALLGMAFLMTYQSGSELGIGATDSSADPYTSAAFFEPEPTDVDGFVGTVDAIVVAQVTSVSGSGNKDSYDAEDNIRNIKDSDPFASALPTTDYGLTIERVILGENLRAEDLITLRIVGEANHVERYPALMQMPQIGDHRIYGLSLNPDGTYGVYSWWSQFVMSDGRVTHADDLRKQVSFVEAEETEQFIEHLESAASRLNGVSNPSR